MANEGVESGALQGSPTEPPGEPGPAKKKRKRRKPQESESVKKRPYHRQKFKKQVTVRIDEDLLEIALRRAEHEGLRLTDAVEQSLWDWVKTKYEVGAVRQGRFLWNVIPLDLHELTLSFWAYMSEPCPDPGVEIYRRAYEDVLRAFRKDPECDARLKRLAGGGGAGQ